MIKNQDTREEAIYCLFNYLTKTDDLIKTNHKENTMKFVVIGADAAGMSAASRAKRSRPDLDVTVLEKTLDVSYSA